MSLWSDAEIRAEIPALQRYARLLTRDRQQAEDLVQQSLLRAVEKAATHRPGAALKPWLIAILRNEFLASRRSEVSRQQRETRYALLVDGKADSLDPNDTAFVADVARAFETLSEDHRSVLHLIAIEGMTYRETAEALQLPIGTVMSRLARARSALKNLLSQKAGLQLRLIGGSDDA